MMLMKKLVREELLRNKGENLKNPWDKMILRVFGKFLIK